VDTTSPSQAHHPAVTDAASQPAEDLASGNIDKVRDILFGGQMRDYERRFVRLEERLVQETGDLKEELRRRMAALEQFVKQEAESLSDRISTEQNERADAARAIAQDGQAAARAFEKKASQLDDAISRVQRDLRQQILDLHQTLSDDVRQKTDDVVARLNRAAADLRNDKTDRATLASLLTEMAMRLTNELSIPVIDKDRHG
jgi:seryl-tRNA synthetase